MKENRWKGILPTLGVFAAEFLIAAAYLYPRGLRGELLSVRQVSSNPTETLMQSAISFLVPAVLLVLLVFLLKKDFASQLCLKLKGRWQIILTGILCTAILGITVYCLIVKADKGSILFALLYYLVFIAFAEEFVYRDVCTWFLRERSWPVRYP